MGPLSGVRVVEFAGKGPAPFCCMLLADMGAEVIQITRAQAKASVFDADPKPQAINRGRLSIAIDMKNPEGLAATLRIVQSADILIEGYRPGVMERLGLGPEVCLAANPGLVFGRMTGWGQAGPLSKDAGHDINYIAVAGALGMMGTAGTPPPPPLNLVGDMGGGGLFLAFGAVCALLEARASGKGQVVDAAMVDGASLLLTMIFDLFANGRMSAPRGHNLPDGGAPFYRTYETADAKHVAVGAIEPEFYAAFCKVAGLDPSDQMDERRWPTLTEQLEIIFRSKTRDEWCKAFEGVDACFTPVLGIEEIARHPHNVARGAFIIEDGALQPAPGPRFSRTPGAIRRPPPLPGEHPLEVLESCGFDKTEIDALFDSGAVRGRPPLEPERLPADRVRR